MWAADASFCCDFEGHTARVYALAFFSDGTLVSARLPCPSMLFDALPCPSMPSVGVASEALREIRLVMYNVLQKKCEKPYTRLCRKTEDS